MRKLWQNDEVEELLRKYNPFGLRSPGGRPYEFTTRTEVYLTVMVQTFRLFPRGYIESVLFISNLYQHLTFKEAREIALWMEPVGVHLRTLVDYHTKEAKEFFGAFFRGLHGLCESEFDNNSFKQAWDMFQNRLELETLKNQQKNEQEQDKGNQE